MTGALALGIGALLVLFVASVFWLARLVATAPEGYEDDAGWHPGPEPYDDRWAQSLDHRLAQALRDREPAAASEPDPSLHGASNASV